MGIVDALLDNPILVKHLRSRLRPWQVLPMAAVVLVVGVCTAYAGTNVYWVGNVAAVKILLGFQVLILIFGGSNQINVSLGGARETGVLDFHRVSPLPPSVVALGFFLGAPIREYALAAVLVPFVLYSGSFLDVTSLAGVRAVAGLELALVMTAWVIHASAVLGSLTRKKPRGSIQGSVVTVIVLLVLLYLSSVGLYFGTSWFLEQDRAMNLFGYMVPWVTWLAIVELPVLGFLGLASARKMKAERAHSYTKAEALACMATLSLLLVGAFWRISRLLPVIPPNEVTPADAIMIASVYALAGLAMILVVTITPDAGEYVKGMRRAAREGRRRPGVWSDAGSNRAALFALCALVLVAATAVVYVVGRQPVYEGALWRPGNGQPVMTGIESIDKPLVDDRAWLESRLASTSRPIIVGVLTVAYFGLGLQFFSLRARRSGGVLMAFFLFLVWLGPMLAGAVVGLTKPDSDRTTTILGLSPLTGIALSSGLGSLTGVDAIRFAALAPAITFAFVFNSLLVMNQRKIDRLLHDKEKSRAPDVVKAADAE